MDGRLIKFVWDELVLTRSQKAKMAAFLAPRLGFTPVPHRVIRGNAGGKYKLNNIMWISPEQHKELHQGERLGKRG